MKGGQNLAVLQQKKKKEVEERWIHPCKCMVCGKDIEGYHGRYGDSGTCNATCEAVQAAKYPFPGHTAEAFERLHNL